MKRFMEKFSEKEIKILRIYNNKSILSSISRFRIQLKASAQQTQDQQVDSWSHRYQAGEGGSTQKHSAFARDERRAGKLQEEEQN
jgi:hypothetical protein